MSAATDVVPNASDAFHAVSANIGSFFFDFISFIIVAAVVFLFALYFGRNRMAPLIAGLYTALALYAAFPYFSGSFSPYLKIGLYVLFSLLGFVAFSGLSYFMAAHAGGFLSEILMSVLIAGFILAISIHTLPVQDVYAFTAATKALFASQQSFFWWLVAPLAGLFFLGR